MSINWSFMYEEAYRLYLQRLGYSLMMDYWGDEAETDSESEEEEEEDCPDDMLIATPEGSDWGDDLDELPGLEDFLP